MLKYCKKHGLTEHGFRKWNAPKCKKCMVEYVTNHYQKKSFKKKAIEYKGGKCENPECGYNKCTKALEFHHIFGEKEFNISGTERTDKSWEEIKKEVDKCMLVCSNCHREIHSGMHDITTWSSYPSLLLTNV